MKLAELLALHAPYLSKRSDSKLCLLCLDENTHGEFESVEAWAEHVAREVTRDGWQKRAESRPIVDMELPL